jgi:inner membrane transporter RhtA
VLDQLAMARLPRATFALLIALLPATAVLIGVVVLGQWPTAAEVAGVGLVITGVVIHRPGAGGSLRPLPEGGARRSGVGH